jgi:hypothetical protein
MSCDLTRLPHLRVVVAVEIVRLETMDALSPDVQTSRLEIEVGPLQAV